jgi:DNA polymerase III gamma/tau subunit
MPDIKAVFKFLGFLQKKQAKEAIEFLNQVVFQSVDLKEFVKLTVQFLREALFFQLGAEPESPLLLSLSGEELAELKQLAAGWSPKELKIALEAITEAENKMKYSSILQLPLELAIIEICTENG